MKQFDVYLNPIVKGRALYPYVCCLQSELLDGLFTRVVCFVTDDATVAFDKVSVPISINDTEFHLCMNVMATIESNRLSDLVGNVMDSRDAIVNAYDALLMGI
ncbi:CcdB family protein [uncultured Paraglaciecola sp.]|uniref:CcdB family protein n=1 Tax=uncultured Paraglaciecola sp. TaxID=1765024 RepID=UPI0030DA7E26|tara:strand:+ start:4088 stop:4396 length:309 start_codon:yes stop_codon:yes gene_type:complete